MCDEHIRNLITIQVDPEGLLVCIIGDREDAVGQVGFDLNEELYKAVRDFLVFQKATSTSLPEHNEVIQQALIRLDKASERIGWF